MAETPHELPEAPHALSADGALRALGSSRRGLAAAEAATRLAHFGRNALPRRKPPGLLRIVLRQFASPLIYVLLLAAVVALAMGDYSDTGFILVVLCLNALIGTIQEHRAEQGAEALRGLVAPHAQTLRDGTEVELDSEELVPGDILLLESGARVPADVRLLDGRLEVDESLLTGESVPVTKRPDAELASDTALGDRVNMAFAGTIVARGRAHAVVVRTGGGTQLGQIAHAVADTASARPPLLVRMERFTRKIALAVLGAVIVLGGTLLLRGAALHEVFLTAVALAVAVIPEGLPVAMTVALSIAVRRMSQRKVIARRLAAVEALGSCTFIASDKTGTLTQNQLRVTRLLLPGAAPEAVGDAPVAEPDVATARTRLLRAAVLCNDASLVRQDGALRTHGDAVDVALLLLGDSAGLSRVALEAECPRLAEIPFEAEQQFAATVNQGPDGARLHVKGAGERVLDMCAYMATPDGDRPLDRGPIEAAVDALAAQGFRTLAIAEGPGRVEAGGAIDPASLAGLTLLGFVGMIDPLRPEAGPAIAACRRAGIQVAMVTGDHPVTALAIARELDLARAPDEVIAGPELAQALARDPARAEALIAGRRVFARVEPQQKLQIVQSLQRQGHFVAVTGDGANDAPAMRAASIGVAMGQRGTDVAREVGELILTDDNFASIVAGVEEGRIAYENVRKVIFLLVSTGAAAMVLFVLATAMGLPLPLYPVQLLWLNLVTNGIQDVALAFEPAEGGELDRPPRSPREPIFNGVMIERVVVSGLVMGGIAYAAFDWMLGAGWGLETARNALLLLLVLFGNAQVGIARSERRSLLTLGPLRNRILIGGTLLAQALHIGAMYTPGLREILHVAPLPGQVWLVLIGLALVQFFVMELEKAIRRARLPGPARRAVA